MTVNPVIATYDTPLVPLTKAQITAFFAPYGIRKGYGQPREPDLGNGNWGIYFTPDTVVAKIASAAYHPDTGKHGPLERVEFMVVLVNGRYIPAYAYENCGICQLRQYRSAPYQSASAALAP